MGLKLSARQTVFVDTAPFIYYFEDHPDFAPVIDRIFNEAMEKDVHLITSMVTYIELTTLPAKKGNKHLAAKYRELLSNSEQISIYPLNMPVADAAVTFRSQYNMRTPDAIQLGTAEVCGADYVLTNDSKWKKVDSLNVILVSELAGNEQNKR